MSRIALFHTIIWMALGLVILGLLFSFELFFAGVALGGTAAFLEFGLDSWQQDRQRRAAERLKRKYGLPISSR
jgi:hypothetical protein